MRVLITGVAGRLGRLVATELVSLGHDVIGIDVVRWEAPPQLVEVIETDLLRRHSEDLFRTRQLDAVVHLSTATHLMNPREERCRLNLLSAKRVIDFSHRYGVGQVVFVSRHTYYGATPEAALYLNEEEPPLGLATYPELADIVASDLYAGSSLWRYPQIQTAVLRPCFTLGPSAGGTLAAYLGASRIPTVMGFDPLVQLMHEFDAAHAIVLALQHSLRGVYNVAGPTPIPLSALLRDTERASVPVPEPLFRLALGRFGLPQLPEGAISMVKYPIVVDAEPFRRRVGFRHQHDEHSTLRDFVEASPVGLG